MSQQPRDNGIRLRPEQEWLLAQLVEAHLSQPPDKRHPFWRFTILGGPHVVNHAGFEGLPDSRLECAVSDLDTLKQVGLISFLERDTFYLTPAAFDHYEQTKRLTNEPMQRVETDIRRYLDADAFRNQCPDAYQKWADAERQLWSADVEHRLTSIGHLCREAMQVFATCLVERYQPATVDAEKQHDVRRLRAVIQRRTDHLGTTEKPFIDALIAYRGTVSDLASRQEHGAQRKGKPLTREDARRIVFQTAVVMFEVARALTREP